MMKNDIAIPKQIQEFLMINGPEVDVRIYSSHRGYTLKKVIISNGFLSGFRAVDNTKSECEVIFSLEKVKRILPQPESLLGPKIHIYLF